MKCYVVGCSDCRALWIIDEDVTESVSCPTCDTRHDRDDLRLLGMAEHPEPDEARKEAAQQRSALLADRRGYADADLDHYATQDVRAAEPIVEDADYLDGLGLDPAVVDELTGASGSGESAATTEDRPEATRRDAGTGPDVDVHVSDRRQLRGAVDTDAVEPGVRVLEPGGQLSIAGQTYEDVSPRTSEWLPQVLGDVLPPTARLVQDLADDRDAERAETFIANVLVDDIAGLAAADASVSEVEEARSYLDAIGRYALLWADDDYREYRGFEGERQFALVERTLATTGTGRGQFNADPEALRHSLCALHAERQSPLPLTFRFEGREWVKRDEDADIGATASTVKRALHTFDVLADGFDVRLQMSPGVRQRIRRLVRNALDVDADEEPPAWAERFAFLTDDGTTSRRVQDTTRSEERADLEAEAWEFVDDHSTKTGILCVLANLDPDSQRSMRALRRDDAIDYADGTIGRYVGVLEAEGLVDIDTAHASNRLSLTPLGEAAQEFVDPTGGVVPPPQSRLLGAAYGHPSPSHKYSVSPQQSGGDRYSPAERWMAETGDAREAGYVQWLGDASGPRSVEPPVMHRRLSAAERVKGVNLVDTDLIDWTNDDQAPDGDGRVAYTSVFDDAVQVVTQWGGPAQTLGRLCGVLLSNKMLSKALNIDVTGEEWENIHDGVGSFENTLDRVLTGTQQVGWMSEDEKAHYDHWRTRWGGLRAKLLSKVAQLQDMDGGLRSDLFEDLHGLLASTTQLYHAAGLDVTTTIRMPRVDELRENDHGAYQDFLDFLRFTSTKQAGYRDENGVHSWYRMCIEDRPQKLRSRGAYAIDDDPDPTADLTMSWVIAGEGVSSMRDHIEEAIEKESGRLRDRVADGEEKVARLEIPVVEANSHAHIRGLVREFADRKGFNSTHRDDLDRLTRVLEAALATDDRGADPYLVADALDSLESSDQSWDSLNVHSVENALASLPAESIFPTLAPSARRMLSSLFASDDPLTRQDLIEVTSESSYNRHHKALRAFFLVEKTEYGYVAHLEPWWSSTNDERHPFHEDHPAPMHDFEGVATRQPAPPTRPKEVVLHIAGETDYIDIPPDDYYEFGKPETSWRDVVDELGLSGWKPILGALCDYCHEPIPQSYSDPSGVQIGPRGPGRPESQATLAKALADD